jgi:polyhydroxyalkanoate synthesis regulator phasin
MALAVKTPESEKQPEKTISLPKEIIDKLVKEGFIKIDPSNKQILVVLSGDPDVSLKTIDLISSYFDKTDVYVKKIGNAFMYIIGRNVFVDVPYDPDFVRELKNTLKKREFIGTSSTTTGTKGTWKTTIDELDKILDLVKKYFMLEAETSYAKFLEKGFRVGETWIEAPYILQITNFLPASYDVSSPYRKGVIKQLKNMPVVTYKDLSPVEIENIKKMALDFIEKAKKDMEKGERLFIVEIKGLGPLMLDYSRDGEVFGKWEPIKILTFKRLKFGSRKHPEMYGYMFIASKIDPRLMGYKNIIELPNDPDVYAKVKELLESKNVPEDFETLRKTVEEIVREILSHKTTAVPSPTPTTSTATGEISDEELKKKIEEALEEKTVLEVSLPSPAPQAQQVTAVASQAPAVSEDFEKLRREVEELREIIEKRFDEWARRQGLEKVRLIVFKIPTEYMGSKTVYEETPEGIVEKKILRIDPSKARSLRKKFYDVLHRNAYKIYDMWALRSDADLNEINKVAEEINRTFGVERSVTIVDTYMPRDYVVNALKEYINERKMRYKEVEDKLTKIETAREKRELMRELEELEREINALEQELKKLEKTEITLRL